MKTYLNKLEVLSESISEFDSDSENQLDTNVSKVLVDCKKKIKHVGILFLIY